MKIIFYTLIILTMIPSICFAVDMSPGEFWTTISEFDRIMWLKGYHDAMPAGCVAVATLAKKQEGGKAFPLDEYNKCIIRQGGNVDKKAIQGVMLDLYKDRANWHVNLGSVLVASVMKLRGEDFQQFLIDQRKRSAPK